MICGVHFGTVHQALRPRGAEKNWAYSDIAATEDTPLCPRGAEGPDVYYEDVTNEQPPRSPKGAGDTWAHYDAIGDAINAFLSKVVSFAKWFWAADL